ncbi:MAG: hypothetical protein Q4E29_11600, partial [Lachnospiraceae bacterium]|nr:hypothetical protein [Lachnospiraceae bacterium]
MKVAGRILATMIAMVAILLIAVGADKGLNYLEKRKYEKECQELYAENHAEAEQLRTQIEELSQDEAAVETFLQEYAVNDPENEDEDVLQEFLTASPEENVSVSDDSISDDDLSDNMISGNAVSGNNISGNSISG